MRRPLALPFAASLLALFAACGDESIPSDSTTTPPSSAASPGLEAHKPPPIVWGPCPEDSEYSWNPSAECATVAMPLDHDHPGNGTFPYFLARLLSATPHQKQLWFLNGGPGSAGSDFFLSGLDEWFTPAAPGVDFYVPDHRGTGRSAGLTCSGEAPGSPRGVELSPEEWTSCIQELKAQWGDKLGLFNATQAAKDVGSLIDRTRAPGEKVFLYGLSYGTYLVWRYLALYPHQADGVIQDAIVAPDVLVTSKTDVYFEPVLHQYADLCKTDATCSAKMGPDPWAKLQSVFAGLDAGHCAESGFTRPLLRQAIARYMFGWNGRIAALAVPYRIDRCTPEDVTALQTFIDVVFQPADDLYGFSQALEVNIDFSELWESPAPSADELRARADAAMASLDWGYERADVYGAWPKYPADKYAHTWPKSNVPMLMLNGTLDTETPLDTALLASQHYNGPHQTFVQIPLGPHAAGLVSPTTLPDGLPCGLDILSSFVANPLAPPDTSCIASLKPFLFENPKLAAGVFGTGSVWENTPPPPAPPSPGKMKKAIHGAHRRARWLGW